MNEDAFYAALHEDPGDEVTWLALADWLEESGQEPRAELVRVLRQLCGLPVMRRSGARAELEGRLVALMASGVRPVVPEVSNALGMRFALVGPGRFRMGSPRGEKSRATGEEAHEVTLTRPF